MDSAGAVLKICCSLFKLFKVCETDSTNVFSLSSFLTNSLNTAVESLAEVSQSEVLRLGSVHESVIAVTPRRVHLVCTLLVECLSSFSRNCGVDQSLIARVTRQGQKLLDIISLTDGV